MRSFRIYVWLENYAHRLNKCTGMSWIGENCEQGRIQRIIALSKRMNVPLKWGRTTYKIRWACFCRHKYATVSRNERVVKVAQRKSIFEG